MTYEFKFPDLGEGLFEGEIVRWLIKEGDTVKEDQPILEVETAKAIMEIPCPKSGVIKKIFFKEGDIVKVGQVLFKLDTGSEKAEIVEEVSEHEPQKLDSKMPETLSGQTLATPKVRKLARELKIDMSKVIGTGPRDRITEEDIRRHTQLYKKFEPEQSIERIKIHGIRREIAENIVKSKFTVPHATVMNDAIVTNLVKFREKVKDIGAKSGVKVTFLPLVVKAVIKSLVKYPYFNSTLDTESNEIIIKKYYNIGIAVDTPEGVVVPIIKNADKKNIFELAKEMEVLSEKARAKQLSIDDVRGGTFTITNVGAVGSKMSTPVINYPEAAILAMHRIKDSVEVINGQITIQKVMPIAVSFDHRIVDGAQAARFMNEVIKLLEEPEWMERCL